MAIVLQLGAGELMKHSIQQIQAMGHQVYAVDMNPNAPAFAIADGYAPIDLMDIDGVTRYATEIEAQAIIAVNDAGVLSAAHASRHLGLRGLNPETALKALDKGKMRREWANANLSQPRFIIVDDIADIPAAAEKIGYPVIVKPTRNWGSRGVSVAETPEDLAWSIDFAQQHQRDNNQYSIEEYIDGIEMTVEGLVRDGEVVILAKSDKILQEHYRYRVDQSLHYPANLPDATLTQVDDLVSAAAKALGIDNCAIHCELRVMDDQAYLIELGARPGGGHIFGQIVEATSVVSMPQALTSILLDTPYPIQAKYQYGAVYRFFVPPSGIFQAAVGIDDARNLEGVLDFGFHMESGTVVEPYADGASRPGYCVTTAPSREEAIAIADKAVATVRYQMLPLT